MVKLGDFELLYAHHWHNAVVPSPRHSVSWFLPSPYLCSRRTVLKMCFCSWYLQRCYQHRGLLPSYSFLIPAAKLLYFPGSIAMQNIAVRGIRNGW